MIIFESILTTFEAGVLYLRTVTGNWLELKTKPLLQILTNVHLFLRLKKMHLPAFKHMFQVCYMKINNHLYFWSGQISTGFSERVLLSPMLWYCTRSRGFSNEQNTILKIEVKVVTIFLIVATSFFLEEAIVT